MIFKKKIALFLAFTVFFQTVYPPAAMALTSGPTQPEFSSFESVGTSEMVDLFSGDFKYNIPLLNVPGEHGGYPINLFYNSTSRIEDEASMVGLGWNLGIGNISRTLRGVPDDFNGQKIRTKTSMKKQQTIGVTGSADLELFSFEASKAGLNLSLTQMYDNYQGFGYSFGLAPNIKTAAMSGSVGFNFDSFQGMSYSGNLNIGDYASQQKKTFGGLSFGGNTVDGVKSVNLQAHHKTVGQITDAPTFIPVQENEFRGFDASIGVKAGGELWGVFLNGKVSGFVKERILKNKNKWVSNPAFGYMHLQNSVSNKKAILDLNRVKDKPIRSNTHNLALPISTEDVFTISGHGTGGTFTYNRSDVGVFRDPAARSEAAGFTFVPEIGAGGLFEVGFEASLTGSVEINQAHKVGTPYNFSSANGLEQIGHFRKTSEFTGETTENSDRITENYDYLYRDELTRFDVSPFQAPFFNAIESGKVNTIDEATGNPISENGIASKRNTRQPRANPVIALTGKEIRNHLNQIIVPYLNTTILQHDGNSSIADSTLTEAFPHQILDSKINAFIETNTQGQRYVYGLPVMNFTQSDFIASHDGDGVNNSDSRVPFDSNGDAPQHEFNNLAGCNNYLKVVETPEYASSFMLTTILGDDYVDVDVTDGLPNDKDRGQWVKFDYVRTSGINNPYKWRFPFYGANYNTGYNNIPSDNTISFSYGEREQYYPYQIETNTHIAKFRYLWRDDARGAKTVMQNTATKGASSYKVDHIELWTKGKNPTLEKTVKFEYSNMGGAFDNSSNGKMILTDVKIKNYESDRGFLNPYSFDYFSASEINMANNDVNLDFTYEPQKKDRWGCYQHLSGDGYTQNDPNANIHHPYTNQDPSVNDYIKWMHLKEITLPSGAKIELDIGRDHYAYVQDNVATNMFKITGVGQAGKNTINESGNVEREIYFDRQGKPIQDFIDDLYEDENGKQVLFKIYSDLDNKDHFETVTGAAYIESVRQQGSHGVITLAELDFGDDLGISNFNYHPFLISNWQFLKLNCRKLLSPAAQNDDQDLSEKSDIVGIFFDAVEILKAIPDIFVGYYKKCAANDYGKEIDLDKSYIRLSNPDKMKYGDGVRVNSVIMTDIWNNNESYGHLYDYTQEIVNEEGQTKTISTGVAQNEPSIGQEENAVYHIKTYVEDLRFTTDNLKFELAPFNDTALPSSSVGYSKVTVRSLASQALEDNGGNTSSSGVQEHEFYTAKDFPVIMKNSLVEQYGFHPDFILIPFIGLLKIKAFAGAQGYSSESNDMHGKLKKVSYYAQAKTGETLPSPESYVEYFYHSEPEVYKKGSLNKERNRLNNDEIDFVQDDSPLDMVTGELGVCRKMTGDIRKHESTAGHAGFIGEINGIIPFFIIPVPGVLGSIDVTDAYTETGVLNKEISKKGILERIVAYDGQSKVETSYLNYDPITGAPTASAVTNEFNNPKIGTTLPAYLSYPRMGPAFDNLEYEFIVTDDGACQQKSAGLASTTTTIADTCTGFFAISTQSEYELIPGDELIVDVYNIENANNEFHIGSTYGYFIKRYHDCAQSSASRDYWLFDFHDNDLVDDDCRRYEFKVVRSGNRNIINAPGQIYTSLDPIAEWQATVTSALEAKCISYSDKWHYFSNQDDSDCTKYIRPITGASGEDAGAKNAVPSNASNNQFRSGALGVFRPEKNYLFQGNRSNLDITKKGIFDTDVTTLNHDQLYQEENSFDITATSWANDWLYDQVTTKFSKSMQIVETVNPLNIFNCRLLISTPNENSNYKVSENAVHCTASNARFYETAFTSFESYEYQYADQPNVYTSEDPTHFDINLDGSVDHIYCEEVFNFVKSTGENNWVTLDQVYNPFNRYLNQDIELYIPDQLGKTYSAFNSKIISETADADPNRTRLQIEDHNNCDVTIGHENTMKAIIKRKNTYPSYPIATFSDDVAHTGSRSLKIGNGQAIGFNNKTLNFQDGKEYHFSCWAYVDDHLETSLDDAGVIIKVNHIVMEAFGNRINGWQQFRGNFTPTTSWLGTDDSYIGPPIEFFASASHPNTYFDDLRIIPKDASMEAYVYDEDTYQLDYILDDNNYFTKYVYDGNGQLISMQKETERGIKSLQEQRSFLSPNEE